ncbi:putative bifunctional diguanylate cyclase/phosphodiesterase [Mangrovicella endophytica]|uniref:putative bifunctional diguanylate cyclase/phosphodiesterase n=1 Tax=Mangrovicella endophytica TaxID=2066697 RepID=UPI000C9EBD66|nr:EAL domain-containing protein [Mangrovicella endophytica]
MTSSDKARRVLVADDEAQVLDAYRRVLEGLTGSGDSEATELDALSAELFGEEPTAVAADALLSDVVYCRQGEQAVRAVAEACTSGRPFAIVFLDMRMPPGMDGLETARRIRAIDADVNIVIVTGYSDHKPSEIAAAVGGAEKLFYLLKPFDGGELQQLTSALASRWTADIGIAEELASRVAELEAMNAKLKASEAQAQAAAQTDALTGLSNRTGLSLRFKTEAERAASSGSQLAVLYLDLDRFKDVNDSLGHEMGDELIREFARRIRAATGTQGYAARLGGDEFAVISTSPGEAAELGRRLLEACSAPYRLGDHAIQTGVSIGVAYSDPGRPDLVEAMRRADIALYAGKAAGRGVLIEFDPSMERDFLGAQRMAHDLAKAIAEDALALHYQPLVGAEGLPLSGVEALLRWTVPGRGVIPPMTVVEVAEKSDLIHRLGDWVLRRAFTDSRRWPDLITAVNLSPVQFGAPNFVARLVALAAETGADPRMIELEVTETVLIGDMAEAARKFRQLKEAGFRIVLDDFGSGYAGLGYLSQIPFDKLKIDRSFVENLRAKPGAEGVIRSIIILAQSLGLTTTAEGVEDTEQHLFLKQAGCSHMQGFLFGRPMLADDLVRLRHCGQPMKASA